MSERFMLIADRIEIPTNTEALLFDLDGVLLDTLAVDNAIVNATLSHVLGKQIDIPLDVIKKSFALSAPDYYKAILATIGVELDDSMLASIVEQYNDLRREHEPTVHKGIIEILTDAHNKGIKLAVVSNNSEEDIRILMERARLVHFFQDFVGNDNEGIKGKPEPDMYLEACRRLDVEPAQSAVVEDSLHGATAGHEAGCYVVGVATGANSYQELLTAKDVNDVNIVNVAYYDFGRTLRQER